MKKLIIILAILTMFISCKTTEVTKPTVITLHGQTIEMTGQTDTSWDKFATDYHLKVANRMRTKWQPTTQSFSNSYLTWVTKDNVWFVTVFDAQKQQYIKYTCYEDNEDLALAKLRGEIK